MRVKMSELLFYILYFSLIILTALDYGSGDAVYQIFFYVGTIAVAIKIFFTYQNLKEIFFEFGLIVLGGMNFISSGDRTLLFLVVFIIGMRGCNIENIAVTSAVIQFVCIIGKGMISLLDFEKYIRELPKNGVYVATYSMGYSHPNIWANCMAIVIIVVLFVRFQKLKIIDFLVSMFTIYVVYQISVSRAALFLVLIFWTLYAFYICCIKVMKNEKILFVMVLTEIASAISIIGLSFLYMNGNAFAERMNMYLTGRIYRNSVFIRKSGITLWGVRNYSERIKDVDSGYVSFLITSGILWMILMSVAYTLAMLYYYRKKKYRVLVVLSVCAAYAIVERTPFNPLYNPFLLYVGEYCFESLWQTFQSRKRRQRGKVKVKAG